MRRIPPKRRRCGSTKPRRIPCAFEVGMAADRTDVAQHIYRGNFSDSRRWEPFRRADIAALPVNTSAIDTAFLLLTATSHSRIPQNELAIVQQARPAGLHFEPEQHHVWMNARGSAALGFWQG